MLMRFQKERSKKAQQSNLFNLESESASQLNYLTHRGQILSDSNYNGDDFSHDEDDDDNDAHLNKDIVDSLHFGGGMVLKKSTYATGVDDDKDADPNSNLSSQYLTKLDSLQEIINKTKIQKLEKKEKKLIQEDDRLKLDRAFQDLINESLIHINPTKHQSKQAQDGKPSYYVYDSCDK
jgi:hypothetical protein